MTIRQAAQSALDVQNGSNASGIIKSLAGDVMDAVWAEATRLSRGSRLVNRNPVTALYLFKIGELNGYGISSLSEGYDEAEKACQLLAHGYTYEFVIDLDTNQMTEHAKQIDVTPLTSR